MDKEGEAKVRTHLYMQPMVEAANPTSGHAPKVWYVHIGVCDLHLQTQTMRQTYSTEFPRELKSVPGREKMILYYGAKCAGHGRSVQPYNGHASEVLLARIEVWDMFMGSNYASAADLLSMECPRELKAVPSRETPQAPVHVVTQDQQVQARSQRKVQTGK